MTVTQYLIRNGYNTVEDWALDSDFTTDGKGNWFDEQGNGPIDIEGYLAELVAEGTAQ